MKKIILFVFMIFVLAVRVIAPNGEPDCSSGCTVEVTGNVTLDSTGTVNVEGEGTVVTTDTGGDTIEIEIVALSLSSVDPVDLDVEIGEGQGQNNDLPASTGESTENESFIYIFEELVLNETAMQNADPIHIQSNTEFGIGAEFVFTGNIIFNPGNKILYEQHIIIEDLYVSNGNGGAPEFSSIGILLVLLVITVVIFIVLKKRKE